MIDIIHKATGKLVRQYPDNAMDKAKEFVNKFIKKGWVIADAPEEDTSEFAEEETSTQEETPENEVDTSTEEEEESTEEEAEDSKPEGEESNVRRRKRSSRR